MQKNVSYIQVFALWLSAFLTVLCFASCDSGDIYPDEFKYETGTVVKASFTFEELETFPASYQVIFGAFGEEKAEPIVSKTIVKPKKNQVVAITLTNLPADVTSLKLCLTTLGKQPVYTFYKMDIPKNPGDSIIIPKQAVHLMQFDRVQQQVFSLNCVACHGNPGAAGLSLNEAASYTNLVNVAATKSKEPMHRVVPSDVEASFLIKVLENGDILKVDHTSIPAKYNDDLTLLKEWIRNGATKN